MRVLHIGEHIRLIRNLKRMSQQEFASEIGADHYSSVFRYEKNLVMPPLGKVNTIADLGSTTARWVLSGKANTDICDRFFSFVKSRSKSLHGVESDLDLPTGILSLIEKHELEPSPQLIKRYCNFYDEPALGFVDYFLVAENFGTPGLTGFTEGKEQSPPDKLDKLTEITRLLIGDEGAQSKVLDYLKARQALGSAEKGLIAPTGRVGKPRAQK